jgi:hypothetical protein
VDIGIGTLVVWYNKPFEGGTLYDAASGLSSLLGVTETAFSTTLVNSWEPREKRIQAPDNKIALGYALPVTDDLNLAVCFRYATLDNTNNNQNLDGNGNPGAVFGPSAGYESGLGGQYALMSTTAYTNTQMSNGMVVSPQFSYMGSSIDLDFKFDMIWAGVNNTHTEDLTDGTDTGSITQTLKDQGRLSWYARPKLRYMLDNNSSVVLRVSYGKLDLSTLHHVTGSFSGALLTPEEAAGYDLTDQDQELGITQWDGTFGLLKTWNKGKDLILWGVVPSGQTVNLLATSYQTSGSGSTYSAVARQTQQTTTATTWQVPIVMGTEISIAPWCKARSVIQRNLFASSLTNTETDHYSNTDVLTSRGLSSVSTDFNPGWVFNNGFGFDFGQFSWDTALNLNFLAAANSTVFVNPLYQSSFTYEF